MEKESQVKQIRDLIEKNLPVDLESYELTVNTAASILKDIFRAFTKDRNSNYNNILIYPSLNEEYELFWPRESTNNKEKARNVIMKLPIKIRSYYSKLICTLNAVSINPLTKIDKNNLIIIFSPILQLPNDFLNSLLTNYEFVFTDY